MKEIEKLYHIFRLKEVERGGVIKGRPESAAEHVWGCLICAEYFLPKIKQELDQLKVFRILTYHDMVEIEAGDTFILDEERAKTQEEREDRAYRTIQPKIPKELAESFRKYWNEYKNQKSMEARFCMAIDKIEPMIHYIYKKEHWRYHKFTEKKLREKKEKYFRDFPEIMELFNKLTRYARDNGYFTG